jgi:nucleoid DNA-binding protein
MAKKAAAKSAGAKGGAAKAGDRKKSATKSQILSHLAESTSLTKKQVESVLDGLGKMIETELSKKGPGVFTLPGLLRLNRAEKGPTPAKMGRNPRTGEAMPIAAKPKRTVVRARVLKALKEAVK